jgi:hypothetical protein
MSIIYTQVIQQSYYHTEKIPCENHTPPTEAIATLAEAVCATDGVMCPNGNFFGVLLTRPNAL